MISKFANKFILLPLIKKLFRFYLKCIQELCSKKGYFVERFDVIHVGDAVYIDLVFDDCIDKFPITPDAVYWTMDEIGKHVNLSCQILNCKEKGYSKFTSKALKEMTTWANCLPEVDSHIYWQFMSKMDLNEA